MRDKTPGITKCYKKSDSMTDINNENCFYVCDGSVIKNVEELFESLQDMPNHVFDHHVNSERNDFHTWVKDCFNNRNLALNLKKANNKDDMLKHIFVSLFR